MTLSENQPILIDGSPTSDGQQATKNAPMVYLTPEGGIAIKMTNDTGAASIKGTIVHPSTTDSGVETAATNAYDAIGVVYSDGVANGTDVWVVIAGVAEVLLEDGTASTAGNWVNTSGTTAGRGDMTSAVPDPPTSASHFQEIGHCIETVGSGTDVLAKAIIHFN